MGRSTVGGWRIRNSAESDDAAGDDVPVVGCNTLTVVGNAGHSAWQVRSLYHIDEIRRIAEFLDGKRIHPDTVVDLWTAGPIKYMADRCGYTAAIEKAGGSVNIIEKKVLPADEAKRQKTAEKKAKGSK